MSNQPSTSAAYYHHWTDSSDDDDRNRERLCTTPINGILQNAHDSSNASAQRADHLESSEENESDEDETPPPRSGPGRQRKYRLKTQIGSNETAPRADHLELSEGNESDHEEVAQQWRRGRPGKDEVKSRAQLQARSKRDRFAKKPKSKSTNELTDLSPVGEESDSGNDEEQNTSQPQIRTKKGRFAKKPKVRATSSIRSHPVSGSDDSNEEEVQPPKKKKTTVLADEQARNRKKPKKSGKTDTERWAEALALQAARDQERTAKRERPLNRYILERPPTPEPDSDEEPPVSPPPPTEEELAALLAKKQERHRRYMEKKAKREEELARKREKERIRRLVPSKNPKRGGTFDGCPSTRATDRTGNSTTWEDWRKVIYCDEEKERKKYKKRTNKQIRPLKPRIGPPANNGLYAVESRRLLEKDEDSGFHPVAHNTKKKEETDSDEEDDLSDNQKPPKSRNHSTKVRDFLKKEFEENLQYLDEKSIKRIMGKTKLSRNQVMTWFANTRRKVQRKFKKGEISELPKQMAALEKMNKERMERGEHLKMRDPESDEEIVEQEDPGSYEEESEDSTDSSSEISTDSSSEISTDSSSEEDEEDDEGVQEVAVRNLEWLSTVGYPVFPGEKPYRKAQNDGL